MAELQILSEPASDGTIMFYCPGCDEPHGINTAWEITGTRTHPTINPSVLVMNANPNYRCHSYIRDGKIEFLSDSTHKLGGQTVELIPWSKAWIQRTKYSM